MKVPIPSQNTSNNSNNNNNNHNNNNHPKPLSSTQNSNNNNNGRSPSIVYYTNTTTNLCHEPTSVLDLGRSPSPAKTKPAAAADPLEHWEDDHVFQTFDWESIMKELDFNPSNNNITINSETDNHSQQNYQTLPDLFPNQPPHHLIDPHHNQLLLQLDLPDIYNFTPPDHLLTNTLNWNINTPPNLDYSIQELLRAADCFDSNDLQVAHAILDRLTTQRALQYPSSSSSSLKPLHRAAFFFKEALQNLLYPTTTRLSSWSDIVQTIPAYKTFTSLSPIPMFSHFTANQALLDSIPHPTNILHVIDFDIGLGCRYASLLRELSTESPCKPAMRPFLHVTAIVPEDYAIETKLIKDSLTQFANDLNIRFNIDFVLLRAFEMLSFKSVKFDEGEKTAVILSQTVFRRLGAMNDLKQFVVDLSRVCPHVVVCTESEGWAAAGDLNTLSFRKGLVNSLEFYSMVFESLDAAGCGGELGRKIEVLMKPRILAAVEGRRGMGVVPSWKEVFFGAGFRPVQLSRFADFQAEYLLEKVRVRGFDVAKRQAELVLCWHQRPLLATSAWRCN